MMMLKRQNPLCWAVAILLAISANDFISLKADTIGFWRFDEATADDGAALETAVSETNSPTLDAPGQSGPLYSNDVPGSLIQDPVSGASWSNRFSQDCSNGSARVEAPNNTLLNPENGFTFEFFIKLTGQPGGWHTFVSRNEGSRFWQIDFDHNTQPENFGDIRTRWDTPDGDNNNVAKGEHVYVDTDTGSGNPDDYDDPTDLANDGDGVNDLTEWHHVALTWDPELKQFAMFTNYEETGRKDLIGAFAHPDDNLSFGKHSGEGYGMFIDEVRYSSGVLQPDEFLIAGADSADSDGDGLPDAWEQLFFDSLAQTPAGDPDGDGLSNIDENTNTTNPTVEDTDGDGLNDGAEIARNANPNLADTDGDLLSDGAEVNEHGTNPTESDSDGDGAPDGVEIAVSSDPNSAASKPADGEVYFVNEGGRWDEASSWSDDNAPAAGQSYFVSGGLANKLTNPRVAGATFAGDRLTIQGEGAQLGIERAVNVPALTLADGGALISDGSAFTPELTGTVTVSGSGKLLIPANGRTLTINGPLEGSGEMLIDGLLPDEGTDGTVTLAGSTNAFSGNWTIGRGLTLKVTSAGALDDGDITLIDGALDVDYNINNPGILTLIGDDTTRVILDQDHIFGGLFVNDTDVLALAQANGIALDGVFTADTFSAIGFPEGLIVDGGGSLTISPDSDSDGLADLWETANFGDLSQDADGDPDNDTLTNGAEILAGSDPNSMDSDGDTLSDGQEVNELKSNPGSTDTDGDGVADNVEFANGTSLILADTDGDTLNDGDEITAMTEPLNPDTDGDRYPDGIEVSNGSDPLSAGSAPPLFIVRALKGEGAVNNIDQAEALAAGNGVAEEIVFYQESVNFTDNANNTHVFEGDTVFPFASNLNLSINATGTFVINQAGTYSIGANSDDGFRISIDGEIAVEFLAGRGTQSTVGLVDLAAGEHQLVFDYWQGAGGASVELFISESPANIEIENGPLTNQDQFILLPAGQPADDDSDGLPDAWEIAAFGDLAQGPDDDSDSDGLSNREEFDLGSDANVADTDGDGLNDGPEIDEGTEVRIADTDGDGLTDGAEVNTHGTSPLLVDTDGDRYSDSVELDKSKSPTDANSFPTLDDLVAPDALVHYNFEEGAGTSITNDGTNSTAGTIVGDNVQWLDTAPAPGGGSYLLLPQDGSYVDTNLTASVIGFQGEVNYTAMAWLWAESEQVGDGPGDGMIFGQPTGNALHLGVRGSNYHFGHWGNDTNGGTVTFQEWHHVAWKYDNGVQTIHVDGQVVASGEVGALDNDVNVLLGTTRIDQDRDFVGFIDDVRVYNEPLGDADIAIIALAGSAGDGGGGGPADTDNDGQSDDAEALAGTDPNDPTSVFQVTATTRSDTGVSVSWASVSGKSYDIEYSTSLEADDWAVIGSVDNVTEAAASYEDTDAARTANPAGYYRARIK